ncbi:hypothetical protein GWI33_014493 [Rhynchophorus ferrugineus]|uniref:Uncharacterized protein n=1 Tax=Rhynchophorus ferrugineus TaxID=354439 RepID=A0A834I792_RHYFE|nr:hypothetical protein GWI33_014493 [Rhynchophorus ferrugineus]
MSDQTEPLDLSMPKKENLPLKKQKNVELEENEIRPNKEAHYEITTPNIISLENGNPKRLCRSRLAEGRIRPQARRNLHAEFCLAPPEDVHEKHITK